MVETKHPYLRSGCKAGKATQPIVPSQDSSPGYQSLGCGKDLACGRGGKVNLCLPLLAVLWEEPLTSISCAHQVFLAKYCDWNKVNSHQACNLHFSLRLLVSDAPWTVLISCPEVQGVGQDRNFGSCLLVGKTPKSKQNQVGGDQTLNAVTQDEMQNILFGRATEKTKREKTSPKTFGTTKANITPGLCHCTQRCSNH